APATLEARHFVRELERITFDTQRFVQAGDWAGTLTVDGTEIAVTEETWLGNRDRSWGVRPVGEAEPPGPKPTPEFAGEHWSFWIYAVLQFADSVAVTIMQADAAGRRIVEDAPCVWRDPARAPEYLGRAEHDIVFRPGGREAAAAPLTFHV